VTVQHTALIHQMTVPVLLSAVRVQYGFSASFVMFASKGNNSKAPLAIVKKYRTSGCNRPLYEHKKTVPAGRISNRELCDVEFVKYSLYKLQGATWKEDEWERKYLPRKKQACANYRRRTVTNTKYYNGRRAQEQSDKFKTRRKRIIISAVSSSLKMIQNCIIKEDDTVLSQLPLFLRESVGPNGKQLQTSGGSSRARV